MSLMPEPGRGMETPDWDTLACELRCPRCGYNLRRLPQPRCPECELQFGWEELIATAERRRRGVLFDECWPEQRVRSFFATFVRALWPMRLWRQTRLETCPQRSALGALALSVTVFYVGAWLLADVVWYAFTAAWFWATGRLAWGPGPLNLLQLLNWRIQDTVFLILMGLAVWLGTLALWRTTRRARVRTIQVARVVLLAWAGMIAWRLVIRWGFTLGSMVTWFTRGSAIIDPWSWTLASFLPLAVFAISLAGGFRDYLHLRGGWMDAALALVLALAIMLVGWFALSLYLYDSLTTHLLGIAEMTWPGPAALIEWLVRTCLRH
jgi:hypothetical protein